jgi:hypothetical protein
MNDTVNRDPRTTRFVGRLGAAELRRRAPIEIDDVSRQWMRERLEAAGFFQRREYGPSDRHGRST